MSDYNDDATQVGWSMNGTEWNAMSTVIDAALPDPLTTRGDILYRNSSITTRLPVGTNGQVLTSDGTDVSWEDAASGFSDPMTTRGDIIFRNSGNTTARLATGTSGQVIQSDGTDTAWATLTASDVSDFDTEVANNSAVAANTSKVTFDSTSSTKVGHITVTQAVNLDTMESNIATNNSKVTNATHTGEVTGSTSLLLADSVVDVDNFKVEVGPTNDYVLTADDSKSGGMKWAAVAGSGTVTSVAAGNGLDFTTITGSGSVTMGTPGTLTSASSNAVTATSHTHGITTGIADTNIVAINSGSVADNEYARFTSSGLESRSTSEVLGDIGALGDVVDDTTPQLGGALDINSKGFTEELTAGESVVAGNVCYLKSDGKFWKTDADAVATSKGMLAMSLDTISADATGTFLIKGSYTTSGLTAGSEYYLSTTAAALTDTAPSGTGDIVRIAGYAISTTRLYFNPDGTYIEVA